MKRLALFMLLAMATGCVAVATREGTYLEPLPFTLFIGPPVAVVAPPATVVERLHPLPPVYYEPERSFYTYGGYYYYYWDNAWYFAPDRGGPWYHLPKRFYPSAIHRGRGHMR